MTEHLASVDLRPAIAQAEEERRRLPHHPLEDASVAAVGPVPHTAHMYLQQWKVHGTDHGVGKCAVCGREMDQEYPIPNFALAEPPRQILAQGATLSSDPRMSLFSVGLLSAARRSASLSTRRVPSSKSAHSGVGAESSRYLWVPHTVHRVGKCTERVNEGRRTVCGHVVHCAWGSVPRVVEDALAAELHEPGEDVGDAAHVVHHEHATCVRVSHTVHSFSSAPSEGARCGSALCAALARRHPRPASPRRRKTTSWSPAPHMVHGISSAPSARCTVWEGTMCDPVGHVVRVQRILVEET